MDRKETSRCEVCGAKIQAGRFCPACDAEIDRRAKILAWEWQQKKRGIKLYAGETEA